MAPVNVSATVAEVMGALQQSQSQTIPPPSTMPRDLVAAAEILGQEPGPRRPLGAAGNAVVGAWAAQAAAVPPRVTILRGDGQMAPVKTDVRVAPAIKVTDGFGQPRQGDNVTFTVTPGGGSVVPAAAIPTDRDGVASVTAWTLGTAPGPNQLQASVAPALGGLPVVVDLVALAVPPIRRCEIVQGDAQAAAPGDPVPIDPTVRVVDGATGLPLPGVNVSFAVVLGGGNIANAATVTDPGGIATSGVWQLGAVGLNTLEVTVDGADAVVFTAQAVIP
jgi:hypothetical protein